VRRVPHAARRQRAVELTRTWTDDQLRLNLAKLQRTKGFMPPFAGNADDVEAVVQLLRWERDGRPAPPAAATASPEILAQIARWLDEAGTAPAGETPGGLR
jgi:cytochrome bd ubiquinol oxidase subunit I